MKTSTLKNSLKITRSCTNIIQKARNLTNVFILNFADIFQFQVEMCFFSNTSLIASV